MMSKAKTINNLFGAIIAFALLVNVSGCDVPTYPKERLPEAVKNVCKTEYNMNVDVIVAGSTMGIYYPMEGLLDVGMGISQEAWDKISNLLLIASRVVLSTDADIQFYCVITQDVKLAELQVVIIKYVGDVKKGMYRNISRNESFKRTLFSINLTPQAKKERSIDKVFDKLGVTNDTRQKVLDEFFRSAPTRLSDIGYWKEKFYLKNITQEEFLVTQIANRIKLEFRGDKELMKLFRYKSSEGFFVVEGTEKYFLIKFSIVEQASVAQEPEIRLMKIKELLSIASGVVYGYKFKAFDYLVLEDQLEKVKFKIKRDDVYAFNKKKLSVKDIVQGPETYFQNNTVAAQGVN